MIYKFNQRRGDPDLEPQDRWEWHTRRFATDDVNEARQLLSAEFGHAAEAGDVDLESVHKVLTYVNCWEIMRDYGGPEEGGWYYDVGTPVAAIPCETEAECNEATTRLSRIFTLDDQVRRTGVDRFRISQSDVMPEPFPQSKPQYC